MSLFDELEKYKTSDCYGEFCSEDSCGKFLSCTNKKSMQKCWYPDKIKEKVFDGADATGVKTCDILTYKNQEIFIAELKSKTRDMLAKIEGTCKVLEKLFPNFYKENLIHLRAFLIRCAPINKNPNISFRDTLGRLSYHNATDSLYKNNDVIIEGVKIPISYHRPCYKFFEEGLFERFC